MLTIEPARRRRAGRARLGIALAGGGPLGAFYELGALHALSEAIVGRALTDFDVYVGVSSGSVVAAALANGIDTTAMGSIFIHNTATILPLTPDILLNPAIGQYARRIGRLPEVLLDHGRAFLRDPLQGFWPGLMSSIGQVLPAALFDNAPLERYLRAMFRAGGRTDDFRRLHARLFVVATSLNSGESVAFGDDAHADVAISRAVAASAALPGLYEAVDIDGEHYVDGALIRTMHASLALEAGCDLVICINPLVPFDASHDRAGQHANLAEAGLPVILGQTFRALIHSRMQVGMASYRSRFPQADSLLLQPDRTDARLFFTNVFRYSGRRSLVDHAYQRTRRDLLAQAGELSAVLAKRGLELDLARLRDPRRMFSTAASERSLRSRRVVPRLRETLGRLEKVLG
jgi:predicted acylesterase/phospholipase RssA